MPIPNAVFGAGGCNSAVSSWHTGGSFQSDSLRAGHCSFWAYAISKTGGLVRRPASALAGRGHTVLHPSPGKPGGKLPRCQSDLFALGTAWRSGAQPWLVKKGIKKLTPIYIGVWELGLLDIHTNHIIYNALTVINRRPRRTLTVRLA